MPSLHCSRQVIANGGGAAQGKCRGIIIKINIDCLNDFNTSSLRCISGGSGYRSGIKPLHLDEADFSTSF